MSLKKVISASISAAVCAGVVSGMAVTASAATTETTLSYVSGETTPSTFSYEESASDKTITDSNLTELATYSLDSESQQALGRAKDGDKLTISYDLYNGSTSNNLFYRHGFKIADRQFAVNFANVKEEDKYLSSWPAKDDVYHINANTTGTATVTYTFTLAEGGNAESFDVELVVGDKSFNAKHITLGNTESLESFTFNTTSRSADSSKYTKHYATLQNFSAKLTTTTAEPTINEAQPYNFDTNTNLAKPDAKGFTATFTVEGGSSVNSLTWYLKKGTGDWKELGTGTLPEMKSGDIKVGLIVYDLPDGVTANEISAGYTYTQTIQ